MFWNRKTSKSARNVRKNLWKPESKPTLLDRAGAGLSAPKKERKKWWGEATQSLPTKDFFDALTNDNGSTTTRPPINPAPAPARAVMGARDAMHQTPQAAKFAPPLPRDNEAWRAERNTDDRDGAERDPAAHSLSFRLSPSENPQSIFSATDQPRQDRPASDETQEPAFLFSEHQANESESAQGRASSKHQSGRSRPLGLIIVGLWALTLLVGWLVNPWFWQAWRGLQILSPSANHDVVVINMNDGSADRGGETAFFRGLERMLYSDAKVIGFVDWPHQFLPLPDDPLQFDRLTQTLERFPRVVLGLPTRVSAAEEKNQDSSGLYRGNASALAQTLRPTHLLFLPASELNAPTLFFKDWARPLAKLIPRVGLGFIDNPNIEEQRQIERWQTTPLLAMPEPSLLSAQTNSPAGHKAFLPSFAWSLMMHANGVRPAQFQMAHSWWGKGVGAGHGELLMRSDGRTALQTVAMESLNAVPIVDWRTWVEQGKVLDLAGKIVLVGDARRLIASDASAKHAFWTNLSGDKGVVDLDAILHRSVSADHLVPLSPVLAQAAHYIALSKGRVHPVPPFWVHNFLGFVLLTLMLVASWWFRSARHSLFILFALTALVLSLLPGMAFAGSGLMALILYPLFVWWQNHDTAKTAREDNSMHRRESSVGSAEQAMAAYHDADSARWRNEARSGDSVNPTLAASINGLAHDGRPSTRLGNLLAQPIGATQETAVKKFSIPPPSSMAMARSVERDETGSRPPSQEIFQSIAIDTDSSDKAIRSAMFSDRVLSDSGETEPAMGRSSIEKSADNWRNHAPPPLPPIAQDEKWAWVRESERSLQEKTQHDTPFEEEAPTQVLDQSWHSAQGQPIDEVVRAVVAPLNARLDATMNPSMALRSIKPSHLVENKTDTHGFNQILSENLLTDQPDAATGSAQQHIGRYVVERILGRGAMGVVYLGLDPHINRKVAIKTVPLPGDSVDAENQQLAAKFFREAQAAGKLNHPGIVTVFDAGLYRDNVYIAMEYLEGRDLSQYIEPAARLPLRTSVNLIARVAEALHFAHERGVVHRDIKPANIIFDSANNIVKVTDFGIAHIHDSNRAMTQVLVGSPNYMSPEHLTGEALDGRTDLFSLGVTLFVLACGNTPFYADNVSRLMFSILNDPPRDIRQFNPQVPDSIVAILNRALQKDRQFRYVSGASMAQDLMIALRSLQ